MARELIAYSDIFSNSSGEEIVPEEFVVILSGSQIKTLQSFLNFYAVWRSSWSYPSNEEWDKIEAHIGQINFRLGGESVYQIAEKLNEINTTLQEMRDKMGSGNGDGEGNTIQDLIFWLKILFAISSGGGALAPEEITTPLLSEVVDRLTGIGVVGGISNVMLDEIRQELAGIKAKINATPPAPLIIQGEAAQNQYDLLVNGGWYEGTTQGLVFYADNWTYLGGNEDSETPQRLTSGGVWYLYFIAETQKSVKQNVRIPSGYGALNLRITNPAGVVFGQLLVKIFLSGELVEEIELPNGDTFWEHPIYGNGGELIGIEIRAEMTTASCGVVELIGYPVGITSTQQITGVGGNMGKGKVTKIKADKGAWTATGDSPSLESFVVGKLDALNDWLALRVLASKTVAHNLNAVRIISINPTAKVCHMNWSVNMSDGIGSYFKVEMFDGDVWQDVRNCTVSGSFGATVDFDGVNGADKLIRLTINAIQPIGGLNFDLFELDIEEINQPD